MSEILVVDDERTVRKAYGGLLEGEGYAVRLARGGVEALQMFAARRPDLVLLDVTMPGMSGYSVCRRIRETDSDTPVVFLTAMESEAAEIRGLGLGADDYVFKSASNAVLLARIESVLSRRVAVRASGRVAARRIELGRLAVDLDTFDVLDRDQPTGERLTKSEADILRILHGARGRLLSHDEIVAALRGESHVMEPSALRAHFARLRRKLGPAGDLIQNERDAGYRMVC